MTTYQHITTGVKVELLTDAGGIVNYRDPSGSIKQIGSVAFHEHYQPLTEAPAQPPARRLYALTPAEHATVLAALRYYQRDLGTLRTSGVHDIATNGGTVVPLDANDIDDLAEGMNHSGLDIGGVCEVIGRGPDDPYVVAARNLRPDDTIDERPVVSESDDGAYVMAWVRINKDEVKNG